MKTTIVKLLTIVTFFAAFGCDKGTDKTAKTVKASKKTNMAKVVSAQRDNSVVQKNKGAMKKWQQMKNVKYTPAKGDLSPEGFNWIHRDLALIYSGAIYEHDLKGKWRESALKEKKTDLMKYIGTLRKISKKNWKTWKDVHQLSFLVNVYHSHWLKLMIESDFKNLDNKLLVKKDTVEIFNKKYSLDEFVNKEMVSKFTDPKVYMSLPCFEKFCPEVRNGIYNFKNIDSKLRISTIRFFIDKTKNYLKDKKIVLSKQVKKYRQLFPKKDDEFRKYIASFVVKNEELKSALLSGTKIKFD